ncbi:MAG: T9SS type A sorting domain-containing protein [Bacteroidetes bacterium]|nr:T9SS type A sorting domain-containing protein [Bacteroidota bacterium]
MIYLQTEDKILDVNLYKMNGALLTKPQIINNTMNTQTLSKGIYIIEIQTEQETTNCNL